MTFRHLSTVIVISVFVSVLVSCGGGSQGSGVVLWPPEESSLEYGMVVAINDSSEVEETYTVSPVEDGEQETVPQWRVEVFGTEERAGEFAAEFEDYAETFASAERQALPVREDADRTSNIVYRLRRGEEAKVISRSDQPSDEAGFVDYWYEVLTRDGSRGWVFGYYLSGIEGSGGGGEENDPVDDPLLSRFLSTTWRPVYFSRMLDSGRIDLERFRANYGLFPEPGENRIRLNLEDQSATFEYEGWSRGRSREFVARGAPFSVIVRAENSISVQYTIDGEGYNVAMQSVEREIAEVRSAEQERREERYNSLRSRGNRLVSNAYGNILLRDDGAFQWAQYSRLVPSVIPASAGASGYIRFDHFLSQSLAEDYEGALSFRFVGATGQPVVFLYQFVSGGLRLAHVPSDDIRDKVVLRESLSPVIIFFSFEDGDST
ncbi:MAG: SH3 domain-containing protein [Spirochaetes bacterium]|nr:SH3 domain-containing protein [Spirochaetota bacterium]